MLNFKFLFVIGILFANSVFGAEDLSASCENYISHNTINELRIQQFNNQTVSDTLKDFMRHKSVSPAQVPLLKSQVEKINASVAKLPPEAIHVDQFNYMGKEKDRPEEWKRLIPSAMLFINKSAFQNFTNTEVAEKGLTSFLLQPEDEMYSTYQYAVIDMALVKSECKAAFGCGFAGKIMYRCMCYAVNNGENYSPVDPTIDSSTQFHCSGKKY